MDERKDAISMSIQRPYDIDNHTILRLAQRGQHIDIKQIFEHVGPERVRELIVCKDEDGYTPLHRASYNGRVRTIKFLIKSGAHIGAVTNDGWQPLHCATRWNHVEGMDMLLRAGANVNARTSGGLTPLLLAASRPDCKEALSYLLLRSDVDMSVTTKDGESVYNVLSTHLQFTFMVKELHRSCYGKLADLAHPSLCHSKLFHTSSGMEPFHSQKKNQGHNLTVV
eukprot:gene7019-9600_t